MVAMFIADYMEVVKRLSIGGGCPGQAYKNSQSLIPEGMCGYRSVVRAFGL